MIRQHAKPDCVLGTHPEVIFVLLEGQFDVVDVKRRPEKFSVLSGAGFDVRDQQVRHARQVTHAKGARFGDRIGVGGVGAKK